MTPEEQKLWRQAMGEEPAERKPAKKAAAAPAPATKKKSPTAPLQIQTGKQAKRAVKPRGEVEAVLDLHGLGKIEAYERVQYFIERCWARGQRHLVIITGKGRSSEGILRQELPHWLNEPQLRHRIGNVTQASRDKGGSGVFHVLLKQA